MSDFPEHRSPVTVYTFKLRMADGRTVHYRFQAEEGDGYLTTYRKVQDIYGPTNILPMDDEFHASELLRVRIDADMERAVRAGVNTTAYWLTADELALVDRFYKGDEYLNRGAIERGDDSFRKFMTDWGMIALIQKADSE